MVEGLTLYQARHAIPPSRMQRLLFRSEPRGPFGPSNSARRSRIFRCEAATDSAPDGHCWPAGRRYTGGTTRDGAVVARRAHNPKVGGSNPPPATRPTRTEPQRLRPFLCLAVSYIQRVLVPLRCRKFAFPPRGYPRTRRHARLDACPHCGSWSMTARVKGSGAVGDSVSLFVLLVRRARCPHNGQSWWLERGGTTRSHSEHGSETP